MGVFSALNSDAGATAVTGTYSVGSRGEMTREDPMSFIKRSKSGLPAHAESAEPDDSDAGKAAFSAEAQAAGVAESLVPALDAFDPGTGIRLRSACGKGMGWGGVSETRAAEPLFRGSV